MYKKIMVPLDGSELAECVFPHVKAITGGCQLPEVVLVQVVQPYHVYNFGEYIPNEDTIKQIDEAKKAGAEDYINGLIERLDFGQADLLAEVILDTKVAESLADYAAGNRVDLIIIATHGRSGVSRWVRGSVADRLLRLSCIPVLMVRSPGCLPEK